MEGERSRLEAPVAPALELDQVKRSLLRVARQIQKWLPTAQGDKLRLLLNAVDAHVLASGSDVQISGSIPAYEASVGSDLATIERTSASTFNRGQTTVVPFELTLVL